MAQIKHVPTLDNAKVIVVDEGVDSMYSKNLIAGWIEIWKEKEPKRDIEILSFSCPSNLAQLHDPEPFTTNNIRFHDYYTQNVEESMSLLKTWKKLEAIIKGGVLKESSIVILDSLSSLVLYAGLSKAAWFVEKLRHRVFQLICIYQRDFPVEKIPRVDTLGTVYIRLEPYKGIKVTNNFTYVTQMVHRKSGGSIHRQSEYVKQDMATYELNSKKMIKSEEVNKEESKSIDMKASFRLDVNEREKEQRRNTPLPYIIQNQTKDSKIIYVPDEVDDFDEEDDPDDDLYI